MDLVLPGQGSSPGPDTTDSFTMMMFMMIAAVILYLFRPNSLRRRQGDSKASRDDVRFVISRCDLRDEKVVVEPYLQGWQILGGSGTIAFVRS